MRLYGHANNMHDEGQGGPQILPEARPLYLATAKRDATALCSLGFMHAVQGGPQDLPEARRLYGLAAAQGHADAQCNLGTMHCEGQGGPQDLT